MNSCFNSCCNCNCSKDHYHIAPIGCTGATGPTGPMAISSTEAILFASFAETNYSKLMTIQNQDIIPATSNIFNTD